MTLKKCIRMGITIFKLFDLRFTAPHKRNFRPYNRRYIQVLNILSCNSLLNRITGTSEMNFPYLGPIFKLATQTRTRLRLEQVGVK